MNNFESPHKNNAVFEEPVKTPVNIQQMRDPLKTLWNQDLTEQVDTNVEQLLKLIDFSQLNTLFENFLAMMGLPVCIIDLQGAVLASSKWQRLCVDFHRANVGTLARCLESDRCIYAQLDADKTYSSHQCGNGLIDYATPIVIEGHHLANLFTGQFFINQPDIAFFKRQQQQFGFDETAYFEAIAEVPVIEAERLPAIIALLIGWAEQIAARSLAEKRTLAVLASVEQQVKERTDELARSHALLQTAQNAARMGHYVTDLTTGTWTNDAMFDDIFGIDSEFPRDFAHWQQIMHPNDVQHVMACFEETVKNRELHPFVEYRIIRPNDGELRWIGAWGHNFYNEEGKAIQQVGLLQDITKRKLTEEHVQYLASYDPLTELANRRLLKERLHQSIKISQRTDNKMAMLMLDLDRFKAVNDDLGHVAGDELLRQVAKRLKARLREMDLVARLGGDEFVVLIENIQNPKESLGRLANDIIQRLSQPFTLRHHHEVTIGVSIGIAIYPQHGNTVEALMDNVDAALYHAKDNGRGCFAYFSDELTYKARERIALEKRLRRAIKEQEFRVYFQPQVDISSGKIVGAEALIRWHDPIEGLIAPDKFIKLAEDTGLIVLIGEWVLRETCTLGRQWLNQGLPVVNLAVNMSPYQFCRCDVNALVKEVLHDTGFPVEYLELEITESGLMENQQHAMSILNDLHNQGVHLAIDDFGTGYSSLAYLKYFPVDVLKIDKTFIDDIPFLEGDMTITSTIIAMGHHLGFKVLAEGVETPEQLAFLQEQGCDRYQGYLFSKPLSADAFATLLADTRL